MIELLSIPDVFHSRLKSRFSMPLPGEESHDAMTSRARMPLDAYLTKHPDYRTSAVLMVLYPVNEVVHTLIIERPAYEGIHSGQLALPGGKTEPEDSGPMQTAIRETMEEVCVRIQESDILGALTPLYIPPSNFLVYPFVAWLDSRPEFVPDQHEVQSILEVPLSLFADPKVKSRKRIHIGRNTFIEAPCYLLGEHVLWGATAMMFSEMESVLKGQ